MYESPVLGNVSPFLTLTNEQRLEIFYSTKFFLRRLGIDPSTGEVRVVDRCCQYCLLADDLPGVSVSADGACNYCVEFERERRQGCYDPVLVREFIARQRVSRGEGEVDSVVAFSGGKDSSLALMLAVREFGLRPRAVLVDNGFIPAEVQVAGKEFCWQLGVELEVKTIDLQTVAAASLRPGSQIVPCRTCIRGVFASVAEVCRERGVSLVIGGHRFPPLNYALSAYTRESRDQELYCVSPLLAWAIPEVKQLEMLHAAGWRQIAIAGNTSNCKLIGVVEAHHYDSYGYNPHLFEVSKEIRAGFYSRAVGVSKVSRPAISADHEAWVNERITSKSAGTPETKLVTIRRSQGPVIQEEVMP